MESEILMNIEDVIILVLVASFGFSLAILWDLFEKFIIFRKNTT